MQNIQSLSEEDHHLITLAGKEAKKHFRRDFISIGGALRTKSGKIYTGINLKYRVRNVSACAETMAIHKALSEGETEFDTVVGVKYFPEDDRYEVVNGCGWCRQLYCYNAPLTILSDNKGTIEPKQAEELLPLAFS